MDEILLEQSSGSSDSEINSISNGRKFIQVFVAEIEIFSIALERFISEVCDVLKMKYTKISSDETVSAVG